MNITANIDPQEWQTLEAEVKPKIEKLDSSYSHFFDKRILDKLDTDRPFFVTPKKIGRRQENSEFTAIQNAHRVYQPLDANGKELLVKEIQQDQALQAIFKNGGIAALEVAVAKKILALVETPEKRTTPETPVVEGFSELQKPGIIREYLTTLEQPATDLSTTTPTPLPASIPPTQEINVEGLKAWLQKRDENSIFATYISEAASKVLEGVLSGKKAKDIGEIYKQVITILNNDALKGLTDKAALQGKVTTTLKEAFPKKKK